MSERTPGKRNACSITAFFGQNKQACFQNLVALIVCESCVGGIVSCCSVSSLLCVSGGLYLCGCLKCRLHSLSSGLRGVLAEDLKRLQFLTGL